MRHRFTLEVAIVSDLDFDGYDFVELREGTLAFQLDAWRDADAVAEALCEECERIRRAARAPGGGPYRRAS